MLREVYTRLKAAGINDRFCKSYLILLAVWMPYAMLFYLRDPVLLRRRPRAAPGQETFWYHWLMPWRWFRWFPHNEENYPFRAGTSPDRQRNTMPDGEATFIDWKPNAHGQTKLEKIIYKNVDTVIRQYSHAQESQAARIKADSKLTSQNAEKNLETVKGELGIGDTNKKIEDLSGAYQKAVQNRRKARTATGLVAGGGALAYNEMKNKNQSAYPVY